MGGCCCCLKSAELNSAPAYYYHQYPRAAEEHLPLSSNNGATTVLAPGLLVANLGTSQPDVYRPPPAPVPFDVAIGPHATTPVAQQTPDDKTRMVLNTATSNSVQEEVDVNPQGISVKPEDLMISDGKNGCPFEIESPKKMEVEFPKSDERMFCAEDQEDDCPTCLEEYDAENPKIITKCEHSFHLSCILEWMERSHTCPICDQEMIFNFPTD